MHTKKYGFLLAASLLLPLSGLALGVSVADYMVDGSRYIRAKFAGFHIYKAIHGVAKRTDDPNIAIEVNNIVRTSKTNILILPNNGNYIITYYPSPTNLRPEDIIYVKQIPRRG